MQLIQDLCPCLFCCWGATAEAFVPCLLQRCTCSAWRLLINRGNAAWVKVQMQPDSSFYTGHSDMQSCPGLNRVEVSMADPISLNSH